MVNNRTRVCWLMVALAAFICLAFVAEYMGDLLGREPVLDARENLAWAERIAEQNLPAEPMYRALLYPAVLALFSGFGQWLPQVASLLGLAAHLLNAWLVGLLARELWKSPTAAWLSGVLYAGYPVAMYFSVQALDITPALSLFLTGGLALVRGLRTAGRRASLLIVAAGFLGGLAVAMRPNFLPAVLLFPLVPLVFSLWRLRVMPERSSRAGVGGALLAGGSLLFVLGLQGLVNHRLSGEFRVLPWQGAYNLYAANREDANGKFYKQRISFEEVPAGMNTTRMESVYLYQQALGPDVPGEIGAMNAFWKSRLIEEVLADPARWAGLMGRKLLYLANDWEQYNNLTYAYHKDRFIWLRYNPLGWGLLLLGAFAGLVLGWRHANRRVAGALAGLALAYAAGLLLFFVSARFRLPLAPFLCIACGGMVFVSRERVRAMGYRKYALFLGGLLGLGVLTSGDWASARGKASFIQDEIMLANAAARLGDDEAAIHYSDAALLRDSTRQDALRTNLISRFNRLLIAPNRDAGAWKELKVRIMNLQSDDAVTGFIRGVVYWHNDEPSAARAIWEGIVSRFGDSAGLSRTALTLTGPSSLGPIDESAEVQSIRKLLRLDADGK